jgi:hypothetical protein
VQTAERLCERRFQKVEKSQASRGERQVALRANALHFVFCTLH